MKVLNLYAGIGGNRKLWTDCEVTAVEFSPEIAKIYKDFFPNDKLIVGDAHEYLLNNYMNYDFIWASPPCQSHSDIRRMAVKQGQYKALYPDMTLYQEIILLQNFAPIGTKWVIENVIPYYKHLITGIKMQRHLFWCNFQLKNIMKKDNRKHYKITGNETIYGFNLKKYSGIDKRKTLRNMVNPYLANHIFNLAKDSNYKEIHEQGELF